MNLVTPSSLKLKVGESTNCKTLQIIDLNMQSATQDSSGTLAFSLAVTEWKIEVCQPDLNLHFLYIISGHHLVQLSLLDNMGVPPK